MVSPTSAGARTHPDVTRAEQILARYREVRQFTESLCRPLAPEDCVVQSMPDVSPTRWHLAHTTWFFETFVLARANKEYIPFHPGFAYLFNSYYNTIGEQFPRARRGLLSRPTVAQVFQYRRFVDSRVEQRTYRNFFPPEARWQFTGIRLAT